MTSPIVTSIAHNFPKDKQTQIQVKELFEASTVIEEYSRHFKKLLKKKQIVRINGLKICYKRYTSRRIQETMERKKGDERNGLSNRCITKRSRG